MPTNRALLFTTMLTYVPFAACGAEPPAPKPPVDVPLIGDDGFLYTAPVGVGSQTLQVLVDTGSTTVGLASAECGSACDGVSPQFAPTRGAVNENVATGASYEGMQSWSGDVYKDQLAVGAAPPVTMEFGAILRQNDFFYGNAFQGILGLGPDDLLSVNTTSFRDQLFHSGIAEHIGFRLCEDHGDMWLGEVDPTAEATTPVYTPLMPSTQDAPSYNVNIADLQIDGASVTGGNGVPGAMVDTGAPVTYMPSAVTDALVAKVTASTGYQTVFGSQPLSATSCMTTSATRAQVDAALPPLSISFPDDDGNAQPAIDLPATRSYLYDNGGGSWCLSVISTTSGLYVTMGDTMQEALTTDFDLVHQQIGFALETGCGNEADVSPRVAYSRRPRRR